MKQTDKIDKLIKNLKTTATPELDQRIDTLIEQSNAKQAQPLNSWRIIMHSKMTKVAAAAIIIIAVLTGIYHFTGSIDGASVAWAQVVEQLSNHEKYKYREQVVREKGIQVPTKDIYHWNLSLRRQEEDNGNTQIIDMRAEDVITIQLYPTQKKAIVTKLIGFGPKKDPDIIDMVKRFEQESTEKLGTKKQNGKILHGFRHQPNKFNDFTVWVDPETKLPVEIELKHPQADQTIFMDEFEFDFNLPMSAFSTDIPDGYEVETIIEDYRSFEPKEISPEDIQKNLNHTAYVVKKLPWMNQISTIEAIDPLGTRVKVYLTGIQMNDGNVIIIVQGNYFDTDRMVWMPNQQLALQTLDGIKLYIHPNGAIYADRFLESLAKADPNFFDYKNLSEERFTRMVVMPNEKAVISISANKKMSDEKLQELAESLVKIESN